MFVVFILEVSFIIKRVVVAVVLSAHLNLLADQRPTVGIALRYCSTTRWDMSKISVPSNSALALWARSNHERLLLRRRHWAGSLRRRYCFETILINEPLCDGWLHKAQIQFRAVLVTE